MRAPLTFACLGDLSGLVRGKGFLASDLDKRLVSGVGWTPTNVQITCFDTIAPSPYGSFGDLVLRPKLETEVRLDLAFEDGGTIREHFLLGEVSETDGTPWACCLRTLLRETAVRFSAETGFEVIATFEHEFTLQDGRGHGPAFSLDGFRRARPFGERLMAALRGAGLEPDSFLREYGQGQYEATLGPRPALRAADEALILRELAKAAASSLDTGVTFAPLPAAEGVGNGVHVHLSLRDADGRPVMHDPNGTHGLSQVGGAFVAGILRHAPALVALTAPSVLSYDRLVPHRWSAAFDNLAERDREACVRVCPTSAEDAAGRARQFNVEYRAADACADPHLTLASLIAAGLEGVRSGLPTPEATAEDLSLLDDAGLRGRGLRRLPRSLSDALEALAADAIARAWYPEPLVEIYLAHKREEIRALEGKTLEERIAAYAAVY